MTQAFNLSLFANKLNTSGQTDNTGLQNSSLTVNTTSPIAGGGAVALGSSLTLTHANSGVAAATYTAATITVNASGHVTAASSNTFASGTVTSVATGNGLSGGTITTTGTLVIACPTFNTVGSYTLAGYLNATTDAGSNYAGGSMYNFQIRCNGDSSVGYVNTTVTQLVSGTWKAMNTCSSIDYGNLYGGLFCRVA